MHVSGEPSFPIKEIGVKILLNSTIRLVVAECAAVPY